MKKKLAFAILLILLCAAAAVPALAADVFGYSAESVQVYDGETVTPTLLRDGRWAEGEVVYTARGGACTVDENGAITGVTPGQVYVQADLVQEADPALMAGIEKLAQAIAHLTEKEERNQDALLALRRDADQALERTTPKAVEQAAADICARILREEIAALVADMEDAG